MTELKPIDEPWMFRALKFVTLVNRQRGEGPTWREVAEYMHWRPGSCSVFVRMNKLARRGLVWDDGVERSTRLSPAGLAHLRGGGA